MLAFGCAQPKISLQPGARTFTPESYVSVWEDWTREKESFSWKELAHEIHVAATFESWEFRWAYVVRYDLVAPDDHLAIFGQVQGDWKLQRDLGRLRQGTNPLHGRRDRRHG